MKFLIIFIFIYSYTFGTEIELNKSLNKKEKTKQELAKEELAKEELAKEAKDLRITLKVSQLIKSKYIHEKAEAIELLKDKNLNNNKELIFLKAELLYYGDYGIDRNQNLAVKYYEMAAKLGHEGALYKMGVFHYYGTFVRYDLDKAVYYLKIAEEMGNEDAKKLMKIINYSPTLNF